MTKSIKDMGTLRPRPELGYPHCAYPSNFGGIYAIIADITKLYEMAVSK